MKVINEKAQKVHILTFFDIAPGMCTSYWKSANGVLYAYLEGELNACSEDGEPMYPVSLNFRIKVPSNMDHGCLSHGFYPGLSVEDEPLETLKKFPHMHRYKLHGCPGFVSRRRCSPSPSPSRAASPAGSGEC